MMMLCILTELTMNKTSVMLRILHPINTLNTKKPEDKSKTSFLMKTSMAYNNSSAHTVSNQLLKWDSLTIRKKANQYLNSQKTSRSSQVSKSTQSFSPSSIRKLKPWNSWLKGSDSELLTRRRAIWLNTLLLKKRVMNSNSMVWSYQQSSPRKTSKHWTSSWST